MDSEWLTPLRAELLQRFFATDVGRHFFLTGGTALAAFHLHHRLSVDLDLFTVDLLAKREADMAMPRLAAVLGCQSGAPSAPSAQHYATDLAHGAGGRDSAPG